MTGDKVNKGTIYQEQDGRYRAEISYLGEKYRHRAPSYAAAEVWLSRKKLEIARRIAEVSERYEDNEGFCEFVDLESNSGPVSASVYKIRKKRKDGSYRERWCVEVQYLGFNIRKTSESREACEKFRDETALRINGIIAAANGRRSKIREESARLLGRVGAEEYAQVIDLFRQARSEELTDVSRAESVDTYVLFDHGTGFYKIGKSKDVRKRLSFYCTPHYEIVLVCNGDKESEMHEAYREKRMRGEWFEFDDFDLQQMQRMYGFKKVSIFA